jgi:hypothetical protein
VTVQRKPENERKVQQLLAQSLPPYSLSRANAAQLAARSTVYDPGGVCSLQMRNPFNSPLSQGVNSQK